jgi:hypothetical protein
MRRSPYTRIVITRLWAKHASLSNNAMDCRVKPGGDELN